VASGLSGEPLAVLFLDLDRFKEVNDALGHEAGDLLLEQVGPRLRAAVRGTDIVARLGGDEFAVILGPPSSEEAALRVADKLNAALAGDPFEVRGLGLHSSGSVGIAMFPAHGNTAQELMQRADVAMYQAKVAGSGRELYSPDQDTSTLDRLALVEELRSAICQRKLEVHFQPKAQATTGAITSVEALVRWQHERRGAVLPSTFIPLAEHAGLSRSLTRLVLDLALAQSRAWSEQGRTLDVSVNLTVADLVDTGFPDELADALSHHGVCPQRIVLEITESSVLSNPVRIRNVLARLGELGVGLSLDDFGTGYSSLTHLRTLPVGELKIDRSFVSKMSQDSADAAIVRSTVELAHSLGMRVVAEGVEDHATWDRLTDIGCDLIQGYVLSHPLPAAELEVALDLAGQSMIPRRSASATAAARSWTPSFP
jgi:diguanylate cyclase (GGDEF)-like protein